MAFLTLAFVLAIAGSGRAEDWPQFRGPGGQGHARATGVPLQWSESGNVVWKVPIEGRAWSSPVVMGDQVWITTAVETPASPDELKAALERVGMPVPAPYLASRVELKAICVDRRSGRVLHDVTLFEVDRPVVLNRMNSYASPTPVAESGRVYCDFGAMGTACLDSTTGKILWSRRLVIEHQVGPGSSPVLYGNFLILVRDGCDRQYVTALDKTTGKTVWKTPRPPMSATAVYFRKAFSTPLIVECEGAQQMIVPAAQWIVSYDPATGAEQWRVDTGGTFSNSSRPVYGDGVVYVCTAYGGTRMLAVKTDGRGDVTDTHVAWEIRRGTPKRSSPLLLDGRLYFISDSGVANCVDAKTGAMIWSERLSGPHSASPVYADGRIYFFGEDGTTTVIRPADEFSRLAENRLDGRIMASPAFVERAIYLRSDTHLYRIEKSDK